MGISRDRRDHRYQGQGMGATTVALMNNSGADPLAAIGVYGREVLPKLSRSLATG